MQGCKTTRNNRTNRRRHVRIVDQTAGTLTVAGAEVNLAAVIEKFT
jgi:hypothetical protein